MKRLKTFVVPILLLMTYPGTAGSQSRPSTTPKSQTLEDLNRQKNFEDIAASLDKLEAMAMKMSRDKRLQCLQVVGNRAFCDCLGDNLPVVASFLTYVQVVTSSKETLGYASLGRDEKQIVDNTLLAREVCVTKVSASEAK